MIVARELVAEATARLVSLKRQVPPASMPWRRFSDISRAAASAASNTTAVSIP